MDYEYGYPAAFSQSYIEDVAFDVLKRATDDISKAIKAMVMNRWIVKFGPSGTRAPYYITEKRRTPPQEHKQKL